VVVTTQGRPVSIAELLACGVAPQPHEAVAIVLMLCDQLGSQGARQSVMPAISAGTVTIEDTGSVAVAGGVAVEDEQTVSLVGRLLLEMLDHPVAEFDSAVPPRLRATATRAALGGRQAFATASQLVAALRRHGPEYGAAEAVRGLFRRWQTRSDRRSPNAGEAGGAPAQADRRRSAPSSDMLRRFLREADDEACSARTEALPVPAAAAARSWRRSPAAKVLLVGVMLLMLASAGFAILGSRAPEDLPFVAPVSKPSIPGPRSGQPAWELLRRPARASVDPPTTPPRRHAAPTPRRELTAPAAPDAAAPSRQQ
jgi:hypothetical protein